MDPVNANEPSTSTGIIRRQNEELERITRDIRANVTEVVTLSDDEDTFFDDLFEQTRSDGEFLPSYHEVMESSVVAEKMLALTYEYASLHSSGYEHEEVKIPEVLKENDQDINNAIDNINKKESILCRNCLTLPIYPHYCKQCKSLFCFNCWDEWNKHKYPCPCSSNGGGHTLGPTPQETDQLIEENIKIKCLAECCRNLEEFDSDKGEGHKILECPNLQCEDCYYNLLCTQCDRFTAFKLNHQKNPLVCLKEALRFHKFVIASWEIDSKSEKKCYDEEMDKINTKLNEKEEKMIILTQENSKLKEEMKLAEQRIQDQIKQIDTLKEIEELSSDVTKNYQKEIERLDERIKKISRDFNKKIEKYKRIERNLNKEIVLLKQHSQQSTSTPQRVDNLLAINFEQNNRNKDMPFEIAVQFDNKIETFTGINRSQKWEDLKTMCVNKFSIPSEQTDEYTFFELRCRVRDDEESLGNYLMNQHAVNLIPKHICNTKSDYSISTTRITPIINDNQIPIELITNRIEKNSIDNRVMPNNPEKIERRRKDPPITYQNSRKRNRKSEPQSTRSRREDKRN